MKSTTKAVMLATVLTCVAGGVAATKYMDMQEEKQKTEENQRMVEARKQRMDNAMKSAEQQRLEQRERRIAKTVAAFKEKCPDPAKATEECFSGQRSREAAATSALALGNRSKAGAIYVELGNVQQAEKIRNDCTQKNDGACVSAINSALDERAEAIERYLDSKKPDAVDAGQSK